MLLYQKWWLKEGARVQAGDEIFFSKYAEDCEVYFSCKRYFKRD